MANSTQITVLNSASVTATVSTLDGFSVAIGTSTLSVAGNVTANIPGGSIVVANATASLLQTTVTGTVTGTTVISGSVIVANATASLLNATIIGTTAISGAIPSGTNAIGSTTIIGSLPSGTNAIGTASVLQLTSPWVVSGNVTAAIGGVSLSASTASIGSTTIIGSLPAGSNQLGSVTAILSGTVTAVVSSFSLSASTASIGSTTIIGVLPAGTNSIGGVTQSGTWNVTVNAALPAGTNAIGTASVLQLTNPWTATITGALPAGTNTLGTATAVGDVASGATDGGNPLKIGGVAQTSNQTAVVAGQRVNFLADKMGRLIVNGTIRTLKGVSQTSVTTTAETTIVGATSAIFNDLYGFVIANTGATGVTAALKDSTAGTTRAKIYCPATDTRGFMLPVDAGLLQNTTSTNWTVTLSAATSTAEITAMFVQNI